MSTDLRKKKSTLDALPWIGASLLLIFAFVFWPTFELFQMSFRKIAMTGQIKGWFGFENYKYLFDNSDVSGTLIRTAIWLFVVVLATILISLPLAQLMNMKISGLRLLRFSVIVPWAASLVITTTSWKWILDAFHGLANLILQDLHLIKEPIDMLAEPTSAFIWLLIIGVFVSLPFTSFVLLAGLQSISSEILDAAKVDGANAWKGYWNIIFPLLRPSFLVAAVINSVYVFNSFAVIWVLTQGGPGYETDTTTTFAYKIAFKDQDIGQASALAVLNFLVIFVFIMLFLKISKWKEQDQE